MKSLLNISNIDKISRKYGSNEFEASNRSITNNNRKNS